MPKRKKSKKMSELAKKSWVARRGNKLVAFIKTVGGKRVIYLNIDGVNHTVVGKDNKELNDNFRKLLDEINK